MTLTRTWLFIPGNRKERLQKAQTLKADVLIYDLEDAVPAEEKRSARQMVVQSIGQNKRALEYVRINDRSTVWFEEDLKQLIRKELAGVMLPKADGKEDILALDTILCTLEEEKELEKGSIRIKPLIETASGLYRSYEIAAASPRVERLSFGSVDFTYDIGATLTKEGWELLYARSDLVVKSRAAGIQSPIDSVFMDIRDTAGLKDEASLAKQLGFGGKLIIHPSQIDAINEIFSPTLQDLYEAKKILEAYDRAVKSGHGAIQVDGKLVDIPVVKRAEQIVKQAELLGLQC